MEPFIIKRASESRVHILLALPLRTLPRYHPFDGCLMELGGIRVHSCQTLQGRLQYGNKVMDEHCTERVKKAYVSQL